MVYCVYPSAACFFIQHHVCLYPSYPYLLYSIVYFLLVKTGCYNQSLWLPYLLEQGHASTSETWYLLSPQPGKFPLSTFTRLAPCSYRPTSTHISNTTYSPSLLTLPHITTYFTYLCLLCVSPNQNKP